MYYCPPRTTREVVQLPEGFHAHLVKALSSLVSSHGFLEQDVGLETSYGAFQPELSYNPTDTEIVCLLPSHWSCMKKEINSTIGSMGSHFVLEYLGSGPFCNGQLSTTIITLQLKLNVKV